MLDRAFCAGMEMDQPSVARVGLVELDRLPAERGFRQTSRGGLTAIREAYTEGITTTCKIADDPATEDNVRCTADAGPERCRKERVVARLATLDPQQWQLTGAAITTRSRGRCSGKGLRDERLR